MVQSIGIRLAILLPTLFFMVALSLKADIERDKLDRLIKKYGLGSKEDVDELWTDFGMVLVIDALLLVMTNSLIIMYHLGYNDLGIIALIAGTIFSIFSITGVWRRIKKPFIMGIIGLFFLTGSEFSGFLLYDNGFLSSPISDILAIILTIIWTYIGSSYIIKSYPVHEK